MNTKIYLIILRTLMTKILRIDNGKTYVAQIKGNHENITRCLTYIFAEGNHPSKDSKIINNCKSLSNDEYDEDDNSNECANDNDEI